ncbi:MAG: hypothetical protein K2N23_06075 [Clostridia bacterium]|nr:hypothetical protein [Clostridia bacterium]
MIVIITGKPRVGKTALNTFFAKCSYHAYGSLRFNRCITELTISNENRINKLVLPKQTPIYTNYEAHFPAGYKKEFVPYEVFPYYLGLPHNDGPVQRIFPYGELHITEGQRYWDSRESATMPDYVSRWFETHGHYWLDIFIDVQRGKLIDLNIRELAKKIIEVQRLVNVKDAYGRILQTTWYCREFDNSQDYETYIEGGNARYRETSYTHEGNIFKCYNSRSCKEDFVPSEEENFTLLEYKTTGEVKAVPESLVKFNMREKPEWWRKRSNQQAVNKTQNGAMKNAREYG